MSQFEVTVSSAFPSAYSVLLTLIPTNNMKKNKHRFRCQESKAVLPPSKKDC